MQHPIGTHALLANSRTAAHIDPDGNVAWLCWPRVDSVPLFFSILDDTRGGIFSVRPASPTALVVSRDYLPGSLMLATSWDVGEAQLVVEDALTFGSDQSLVRVLHSIGGEVEAEVRFGRDQFEFSAADTELTARTSDLECYVRAPGKWTIEDGVAVNRFWLRYGDSSSVVFCNSRAQSPVTDSVIPNTLAEWRHHNANLDFQLSSLATKTLGRADATRLVQLSAAVLVGLHQDGGGIVAAPTTSLPQWPGSSRTWDYRYSWLRDSALAGLALTRVGLTAPAMEIADFLGYAAAQMPPKSLLRVGGSPAPAETTLDELAGYHGARPVRIGNAAASQLQLDVFGEILEFAAALAQIADLPESLATACSRISDWAVAHWQDPDFGIWETRGATHHYTHSRVLAWSGLRDACSLQEQGKITGDVAVWKAALDEIRAAVLDNTSRALTRHSQGGGPDAALAQIVSTGFLSPTDPRTMATLDDITEKLNRNGLLDRYVGQPDEMEDPCGPFVFPTFWMASALQLCGRDGSEYFRNAAAARGPLGLWGEVADPRDHTPLGNYPQTQSHAAFILAATVPQAD